MSMSPEEQSVVFFPTFATRIHPQPETSTALVASQPSLAPVTTSSLTQTLFSRRVASLFKPPASSGSFNADLSTAVDPHSAYDSNDVWEIQVGGFLYSPVTEEKKKSGFFDWDLDKFPSQIINFITKSTSMTNEQRFRLNTVSKMFLSSGIHNQKLFIRFHSPARIVGIVDTKSEDSNASELATSTTSTVTNSDKKFTLTSTLTSLSSNSTLTSSKSKIPETVKVKSNIAGYFETPKFAVSLEETNDFRPPGPLAVGFEAILPLKDGSEKIFKGTVHSVDDGGFGVICDVEDTIKISNVSSSEAAIRTILLAYPTPVPGMVELINNITLRLSSPIYLNPRSKMDGDIIPSKNTLAHPPYVPSPSSTHYVSTSPVNLLPELLSFTNAHRFPTGSSWNMKKFSALDGSMFDYFFGCSATYKVDSISSILERFETKTFVLVGDSAQDDPELFAQIARKFGFIWPEGGPHEDENPKIIGKILHICIRIVQGVNEKHEKQSNSRERFQAAFAGLPD
ncbi:hypothetical protein HK096_009428, partial [Nowakowskiella sp. JEL0078]